MDVDRIPITDAMIEEVRREAIENCQRPARRRMCERPGGYLDRGLPAIIAHANRSISRRSPHSWLPRTGISSSREVDLVWNRGQRNPEAFDLLSADGRFLGRIEMPVRFPAAARVEPGSSRSLESSWECSTS